MIEPLRQVVQIRQRDVSASRDLTRLATRLDALLKKVQDHPLSVPRDKALLSKDGGVCPMDGTRLRFDPFAPSQHGCDVCGATYAGERHDRAWAWRYHLWLSERSIHGALLAKLGWSPERNAQWSNAVLQEYAARYRSYPNRDNVLGPTRLFFSTYLESIWLLQLIVAAKILDDSLSPQLTAAMTNMVDESSNLIASFDEGLSNRQVWNATAVLAAGLFLEDDRRIEHGLSGSSGVEALLRRGTRADGRWHEGENYHLFALRGFAFAAELAADVHRDLYSEMPRLSRMYSAPLMTMFPDLTLAARGDSPYAVSVRQPRFAELWEVGYARTRDERLATILHQLYDWDGPQAEISPAEIAELEQNRPPVGVARDKLGWKALLWMTDELPTISDGTDMKDAGGVIGSNGPIVIRSTDGRHVGLEGPGTGLGHGHPDRLHLSFFDRGPVLMDFGTGSYVDESLHWYRSWLSHNVPERLGGDGRSGVARCTAYDTLDSWLWCRASLCDFAGESTSIHRSIVVGPHYMVDVVDVDVSSDVVVDLPVHLLGYRVDIPQDVSDDTPGWRAAYEHLDDTVPISGSQRLSSDVAERGDVLLLPRANERVYTMRAPGPPALGFGHAPVLSFLLRRCKGPGRWVHVFERDRNTVREVTVAMDAIVIRMRNGRDILRVTKGGVEVESEGRQVCLSGFLPEPDVSPQSADVRGQTFRCSTQHRVPSTSEIEDMLQRGYRLDERHYRRSEQPYRGFDSFGVRWCAYVVHQRLSWVIDVHKDQLFFRPAAAPDPMLDNETPDIHSDGVQIYFGDVCHPGASSASWEDTWRGFLIVPDQTQRGGARVSSTGGGQARSDDVSIQATVRSDGYRITLSVAIPAVGRGLALPFTFSVNEMCDGRQRRAGQLALGGSGWVYLRGDRESPQTAALCLL